MTLPRFSVGKPVTVMMLFLGILLIGGVCLTQLPVDLLPEMDLPAISVITMYEGAAPEDVETKVTEPLERFLSTVPELKHITSTSKEGMSLITLTFEWGTDLDTRANEVRDSVGLAKIRLPDEVDEPRVFKFDISRFPIMVYGVTAKESYPQLETILKDDVVDPLKRLPGVGSADVQVPLYRQINVDLDRERLAAYGLTPLEVVLAVANENKDTPAGNVKMGLTDYMVRVPGEFEDVEPMKQIVLAARNGSVVRLSDVGTVEDGFAEVQRHITINGGPGAIIMVQKQSQANTVEVAAAVRNRMAELVKRLPPDIQIVNVMDSSEDIEQVISDLSTTLLQGGLLAMAVVLIFLRRWRATAVVALTIPFSLILAIVAIYFLGYTINMMSLFGMIIAVGMIVDNAIVILENITRHREEGERPNEGAVFGALEVAMAITASTLTTVCIFFPILFVRGITKIIFTEFAVVVCVVLFGSLASAILLTPMLSAKLLGRMKPGAKQGRLFQMSENAFNTLSDWYSRLLGWALGHRKTVIVLAVLLFAGSLLLLPYLGSEFMPEEDKAIVRGTLHLPVGTRVEETARVMAAIDRIIKEEVTEDERIAVFTRCGTSRSGMSSVMGEEGSHIGSFGVKLVRRVERTRNVKQIAAALRKRLGDMRGLLRIEKYNLESGDPMAGLVLGGEQPLTVNIIGDDIEVTDELAAKIKGIAERTPGTVDIAISRVKGKPELWVNVDRAKASDLGLNVSQIGDVIRGSFYGKEASKYRIHGDEYDIFVRLREPDRAKTSDIAATPIRTASGRLVRADNISDVSVEYGPLEIERKDQGRIVNVIGNVDKRSLGEVVADIEAEIGKLDIPQGVEVKMAGQTEEQRESFLWLTLALGVGIVLVYMVMAAQFESLLHPFVVMFSIPFAFTGVFIAIFLGGHNVSIVVFLGLLMLIGVVVNNAIVLVDYINILRARGLSMLEAVQQAGRTRLRPVLMTALTTIVALVPMAFGRGQGAEIWNPLGLTVLGGLLASTVVTLVLVPTMYSILESRLKLRRTKETTK
ncbi:MAG: efflux RND transporter permease subunit [Planctomycetota bacterium]|nr:efflux RND transporter permease subunit [Planctomycetota bacterium]